jgi:hypothetical protein
VSAANALRAAQVAGVTVTLDGDGLVLEAVAEPPQSILDALARHKRAILDLLRPGRCGRMPEQGQAYFDRHHRVVATNDGRPRSKAESSVLECQVAEWLEQRNVSARWRCCYHWRRWLTAPS